MSLKVDLKSKDVRRGVSFDYGWIFVLIAVLVAFVVFYAYGLKLKNEVDSKQQELKSWQDKVAGFSGIEGKLQALQGDINTILSQINKLRELRYDPLRYSILLVRVSKLLPSNIWFNNMSIDPSRTQVTVSGMALNEAGHPPLASIADFIMNLQNDKDKYFSSVVLQSTSAGGKTGDLWNFNLEANYNIPLITPTSGAPQEGAKSSGEEKPAVEKPSGAASGAATTPATPATGKAVPASKPATKTKETKGGKP